jgi:hypothetical protein
MNLASRSRGADVSVGVGPPARRIVKPPQSPQGEPLAYVCSHTCATLCFTVRGTCAGVLTSAWCRGPPQTEPCRQSAGRQQHCRRCHGPVCDCGACFIALW